MCAVVCADVVIILPVAGSGDQMALIIARLLGSLARCEYTDRGQSGRHPKFKYVLSQYLIFFIQRGAILLCRIHLRFRFVDHIPYKLRYTAALPPTSRATANHSGFEQTQADPIRI